MHFSCKSKDLLKGVSLISNICQSKTTKPILQDIKMVVEKDSLKLLGTDLEVAIKYSLSDADVKKTIDRARRRDITDQHYGDSGRCWGASGGWEADHSPATSTSST